MQKSQRAIAIENGRKALPNHVLLFVLEACDSVLVQVYGADAWLVRQCCSAEVADSGSSLGWILTYRTTKAGFAELVAAIKQTGNKVAVNTSC